MVDGKLPPPAAAECSLDGCKSSKELEGRYSRRMSRMSVENPNFRNCFLPSSVDGKVAALLRGGGLMASALLYS